MISVFQIHKSLSFQFHSTCSKPASELYLKQVKWYELRWDFWKPGYLFGFKRTEKVGKRNSACHWLCWTCHLSSFQRDVFHDLGRGILDSAWQGYNATLLAYGQTGSGKSYSMIGFGANKGIIPTVCEELFQAIENQGRNQEHQVRILESLL